MLRPLTGEHLDGLQQILADADVAKGLVGDVSTPARLESTARLWLSEDDYWAANRYGMWAVIDRGGVLGTPGVLLGAADADEPPPAVGEGPECFYFLARQAWSTGVASEAMTAVCSYLFERVRVPALEALIFAELNPGSVRVAEKLGMRQVGRVPLRGHHLDEDKASETIDFELWRIHASSPHCALADLDAAAFRIGQLIGEGFSDELTALECLMTSVREAGPSGVTDTDAVRERVSQRLAAGVESPGCAHYRVGREEWNAY